MAGGHDDSSPDPFSVAVDDTTASPAPRARPQRRREVRILLVDHADCARRMLRGLLMDIGCRYVADVADGLSALTALHNERFDLVITDLNLPGMGGLELLRAIRADQSLQAMPVLMVAAQARRQQILAAVQARVDGFLLRPFTAAMLEQKLSEIMASFLRQ